jgi:hypothetical protein
LSLHDPITQSISSFGFSFAVLFSLCPRNPERMPRIKPWCLWTRSVIGVWRHVPKHLPSRLSCIYADRLSKRLVLSMDVSYDTLMPCGVQFITIGTHPACSYHDSLVLGATMLSHQLIFAYL